ncbi:tRNA pseudouridine(55) synthase TruB [Ideonella livida]|uniref:tRNA pseudouridine synthase B n=1 Tax=Ideonella livida TaxID=2707176 RepID=A0A7C9PH01_9BURK|nr:tRNA pseudouridine(55) synthase TruB [Ideonella livida]NDY91449.1 tRNA pseudouridine(55) synthase TruB [Ideonella livida]
MSSPAIAPDDTLAAPEARPAGPRPRVPRRPVHGVLLLDKPLGLSSNDALQKVKRLFRAEKAGHTGTLDPLATGLLPICFGAATKFSQASLEADKGYRALVRLGQTRVGGDGEGEIVAERPVQVSPEGLQVAVARFVGEIDQIPPMQSAIKKDGKALYEYARAGVEIERPPRRITIHRLDIVAWDPAQLLLTLDVRCSKGTYVRTLAEDLGEALGCGAHLAGLVRTGSGRLDVADAVSLEALEAMDEPARDKLLRGPDCMLGDWPTVLLDAKESGRFITGLKRRVALPDAPAVRVYGPNPAVFLGSASIASGELIPDRLLSPDEVQALILNQ